MDSTYNHFKSLWRSSANEAVAYSDDFPEALLVLPELIDGSLGDGKATEINIIIKLSNDSKNKSELILKDNGIGITSTKRLLDWAATQSASIEHVYGHGSKKCLTKFMPDYDDAKWSVMWRKVDKRGVSGSLNTIKSPFLGNQTDHQEDEKNETDLMVSGTQWNINFYKKILKLDNSFPANDLMKKLREIICTRYEKEFYKEFIIKIEIIHNGTIIKEDSSKWLTLKETLLKESLLKEKRNVMKMLCTKYNINDISIQIDMYKIISDGRSFKLNNFPLYGTKNIKASRVHIALNGRYIEAMPLNIFKSKEIHNSENGIMIFINFTAVDNTNGFVKLPTPCTTKVKFQEECPIFKECIISIKKEVLKAELNPVKDEQPVVEQKTPEQLEVEKKAAEQQVVQQKTAEQLEAEKKVAEQKAAEKRAADEKAAIEKKAAEKKAADEKKARELLLEKNLLEIINKISPDNKKIIKNYIDVFGITKFINKFK